MFGVHETDGKGQKQLESNIRKAMKARLVSVSEEAEVLNLMSRGARCAPKVSRGGVLSRAQVVSLSVLEDGSEANCDPMVRLLREGKDEVDQSA